MLADDKKDLRPLVDWRPEVTLVPFSGVQILDFGFQLDAVDVKSARFVERVVNQAEGRSERALIPLSGDADRDEHIAENMRDDDDEYSVRPIAALEPFLSNWVPVPVLRLRSERGPDGSERYDPGPSNWARIRTVELPQPDLETGHTHRVQLAIDTTLAASSPGDMYVAPERDDAAKSKEFRFISEPEHMDWFLRRLQADDQGQAVDLQLWVSEWLQSLFYRFKQAERPGRAFDPANLPHLFEHWARYLAYLKVLQTAVQIPKLRMIDTVSDLESVVPVEVDLVLDVGNSRTCGILIERLPDEARVDLARSFPLEIRDLSHPESAYSGLIESRVEFAELRFGEDRFASRSGRRNAFNWPGFVRIGPEALRLVSLEEGTETTSGLSSPKRYLWDDVPTQQDWRFHGHHDPNSLPKSIRSAMRHLNESGDVLEQVKYEVKHRLRARSAATTAPAIRPRFARSALFGFMLVELIAHALVQINDPAARSRRRQSDLPRRLNRIILTFPTATSAQEQAIIRSRAEGALRLVWAMQGISDSDSAISRRPELIVEWDEASCTQLVYLYSELAQKFDGRIDRFFELKGKPRVREGTTAPEPSLRLACIDIGGGTTDLMVTTYWGEANRRLLPYQTFREGFRVAGDDMIQRVVAAVVMPKLEQSIREAGGQFVGEKLTELFGGDIGGQDQRAVQKRRQFVLRVLAPLAIELLGHCELADEFENFTLHANDVLGLLQTAQPDDDSAASAEPEAESGLPSTLIDYIERAAEDLGAQNWRLADLMITVSREDIDAISRETFQQVLGNMGELIHHLDVDILLLTGRPSRLPAVRSILEELAVVPPHRLIAMHNYKTGRWYPFRDPITQRIGDPKSTVAVGGMLILLAETRLPNFKVSSSAFRMRSTARFIGEMDSSGQITSDRVIFSDIDLDQKSAGGTLSTVAMYAPMLIGARQLALERWATMPLFQLDFKNASAAGRSLPVQVTLERVEFDDASDLDDEEESSESVLRREALREAFEVTEVVDGRGDAMKPSDITLRLQTLGFADEYWLDTGVFTL